MASGIAGSRGSKDVTLPSLHLVTPLHGLSSRAVSPFVVPNTTSLVALVKRESLPQLFQHKVTELSPSAANWGHASSPPTWYLSPTETEEGPLACRNLRHLPAHQGAPRRRGSQRRVGVTAALRNLMKEVSLASWGSRHRAGVLLQQPGTGRSKQVLPEKPPYARLRDRYLGWSSQAPSGTPAGGH